MKSTPLNLDITKFLQLHNETKTSNQNNTLAENRKITEEFGVKYGGVPEFVALIKDIIISSYDKTHQIPLRIYDPNPDVQGPGLLFCHGGGWERGSLNSHDVICRTLAVKTGFKIISVGYRLAPENKFPAGLHDVIDSYKWLNENAKDFGIDPSQIAIGGESSGANLAAACSIWLRDNKTTLPYFQLLLCPPLDLSCSSPSYELLKEGYHLSLDRIKQYISGYIKSPQDIQNPLASPLQVADAHSLPPAIIITAGYDPLRDDGEQYAKRLQKADVFTIYKNYGDMIHVFLLLKGVVPEVSLIYDEIAELINDNFTKKA